MGNACERSFNNRLIIAINSKTHTTGMIPIRYYEYRLRTIYNARGAQKQKLQLMVDLQKYIEIVLFCCMRSFK